jgi:hypothetical protein
MSLPVGQQRILERIEGRLRDSDPRLNSLYGIFNRLVRAESMPWFEQVKARPVIDRIVWFGGGCRRLVRPAARMRMLLLLPAALTAMLCGLMIATGFPGSSRAAASNMKIPARELVVKPRLLMKPPLCRLALRVPAFAC